MNTRFFAPALAASLALAWGAVGAAQAQAPIISPPTTTTNWSIWAGDSSAATVAALAPSPTVVSNILFPTNNLASWINGFAFPDQTKIAIDGDAVRVDIGKVDDAKTTWKTFIGQGDLILKEGQSYTLKFRAKADTARQIIAIMQTSGGDFHDVGLIENVDLTAAWQTFSFPFVATGLSDPGVSLVIHMGQQTGTVWLADVTLAPASGTISLQGPSSAIQATISTPGLHDWSIQLNSNPFNIVNGHKYMLSYYIMADTVRRVNAVARINSDDYHAIGGSYWNASVGPSWRFVRLPFTATGVKQDSNLIGFNLGNAGPGKVTIGDVKLVEVAAQ